jgi:hypothetical protein
MGIWRPLPIGDIYSFQPSVASGLEVISVNAAQACRSRQTGTKYLITFGGMERCSMQPD